MSCAKIKPFCETYLRDICVCEGSWHLAMSFFCYHFPFGETQKAWHRKIYKRRTYKLQKKKQKEITEEKIYKRRNFTEEEKTQKRKIFKPTKDKAKADFYKR